jgi:hypothetical protein
MKEIRYGNSIIKSVHFGNNLIYDAQIPTNPEYFYTTDFGEFRKVATNVYGGCDLYIQYVNSENISPLPPVVYGAEQGWDTWGLNGDGPTFSTLENLADVIEPLLLWGMKFKRPEGRVRAAKRGTNIDVVDTSVVIIFTETELGGAQPKADGLELSNIVLASAATIRNCGAAYWTGSKATATNNARSISATGAFAGSNASTVLLPLRIGISVRHR